MIPIFDPRDAERRGRGKKTPHCLEKKGGEKRGRRESANGAVKPRRGKETEGGASAEPSDAIYQGGAEAARNLWSQWGGRSEVGNQMRPAGG